jgi:two-component system chemotaxis sensor kinase CheA
MASSEVKHTVGLGDILLLRGENIQLFDLGQMMGKRPDRYTGSDAIAIIIRTMSKPYAIVVDDILGRYQVVTKQLGSEVQNLKGISGSTILGDGKPALILEVDDLVKAQNRTGINGAAAKTADNIAALDAAS